MGIASGVYCITTFISAFLLFQVQPMIAKFILPWFGGTPAVWSTCLVFFQCALLAGYLYSHLLFTKFSVRLQGVIHLCVIVLAAATLNIIPAIGWRPTGSEAPQLLILGLLATHIGLPYFLLSSTAPLIQGWCSLSFPDVSVYRLYALSNIASLGALLSYPFFFEINFATTRQMSFWSYGFYFFAIICAGASIIAVVACKHKETRLNSSAVDKEVSPTSRDRALWLVLSAGGVMLLLALTTYVSHDIAVIPFLWVIPLSLYLLSFILCFDSNRWYKRRLYQPIGVMLMLIFCDERLVGANVPILVALSLTFLTLFVCCMICNGELVRLKPAPQYLTSFYLMLSLGGALGGIFVGIVAPLIFNSYLELPLSFALIGGAVLTIHYYDPNSALFRGEPRRIWRYLKVLYFGSMLALGTRYLITAYFAIAQQRNFYGVIRVTEQDRHDPSMHRIYENHGRILHGSQFVLAAKKLFPTEYYGHRSGMGLLFEQYQKTSGRTIGVVGLGVGTAALYAHVEDTLRFYEINPTVVSYAKEYFTFLDATKAETEIVLGDGRLSLQREPLHFDILVLDAFSGDSIPVHLLTSEAFQLYLEHLNPSGALAIHISNRHLDLHPVIRRLAQHFKLGFVEVTSAEEKELGTVQADWVILTFNDVLLKSLASYDSSSASEKEVVTKRLWTDDYSNLFEILQ